MRNIFLFGAFMLYIATITEGQEFERYKKLCDTIISSKHLGFDKKITVTVPFEWQSDIDNAFPLVIVFDQQNMRSHNYILNTIDYLTSNEQMPSSVVISVFSEQENRYRETAHKVSRKEGLLEENEKFIFEELIPLAENQYRASNFRILVGHSRYGYFTTAMFCSRTLDLNAVISLSPFFKQDNVNLVDSIKVLDAKKFNAIKYYRFGIGNDYPEDYYEMDSTLLKMGNAMIDSKGELFPEAEHNVTPGLTIGVALYEVFEKWYNIQMRYFSEEYNDMSDLEILENSISQHYGDSVPFSLGVLNGKGWFFYNREEYKSAIKAWQLLLRYYPNYAEAHLYIIYAKQKLGLDIEKSIQNLRAAMANSVIFTDEEKEEIESEIKALEIE